MFLYNRGILVSSFTVKLCIFPIEICSSFKFIGGIIVQRHSSCGVLLFVKYPSKGIVKSRLSPDLDKNRIVVLYRAFVDDAFHMLKRTPYSVIICYHPPDALGCFEDWLGTGYQCIPQVGSNLGERMKNGFQQGFSLGFDRLLVIGSDSPDLPAETIVEAFHQLDEYDAVIGPCRDGGYYLFGCTRQCFSPLVFQGISWSTPAVFQETMTRLSKEGLRTFVLPEWRDVDTIDDLRDFFLRNQKTEFRVSATMEVLRSYFNGEEYCLRNRRM